MDLFLRVITLGVFAIWQIYWWMTASKANLEKPKNFPATRASYIKRYSLNLIFLLVILQVLGLQILPVNYNSQPYGLLLVTLGTLVSVSARRTLGANWAHAAEYQIKKNQTLTTTGIYKYIRNPIYTGLWMSLVGAELVAKSNLFMVIFFFGFFVAFLQSKLEERILEEHFGKAYTDYKKRSKMLIPFVF